MHDRDDYLFFKHDLDAGMRNELSQVQKYVNDISEQTFVSSTDAELRDEVRRSLATPLAIDEDAKTMLSENIQIDVTGDPMRMGFADGRRILILGLRIRVSIPFTGDADLWQCRTNPYSSTFPRGEIQRGQDGDGGTLVLTVQQPADLPAEGIKSALEAKLAEIRQCVYRQQDQFKQHQPLVGPAIDGAISNRRALLGKRNDLSALLGIKNVAAAPAASSLSKVIKKAQRQPALGQKWDVFISHASEDKESFVRPLAAALQERGFAVWFDESTLKLGDSLRRSIVSV